MCPVRFICCVETGADGKVKDRSLLAHSISSFVLKTNSRRILNPDAIAQPRPSRRAKNRPTVAEKKKNVTGKSPEAQLLLIKSLQQQYFQTG